jgi:hypothetical protein
MFEDELAEFRKTGKRPGRGDGSPYVTIVRALSTDPAAWDAWLQANASRFRGDRRYRLGREYDPRVLLDCLVSERYPKSCRSFVGDELLVRYGIDVPFEPDFPVSVQWRALRRGAQVVQASASAFEPGRWYCFGSL